MTINAMVNSPHSKILNLVACQVKAVKVKMEGWKNGQDKSVRLVGPVMSQNGEDWGGPERLHSALPLPIISSLPPSRALNVSGSTRRLAESCRLVWPALARTCILYVSLLPSHTISWVTLIHPFPGDRIVWAFSSNRDSGLLGGRPYTGVRKVSLMMVPAYCDQVVAKLVVQSDIWHREKRNLKI